MKRRRQMVLGFECLVPAAHEELSPMVAARRAQLIELMATLLVAAMRGPESKSEEASNERRDIRR